MTKREVALVGIAASMAMAGLLADCSGSLKRAAPDGGQGGAGQAGTGGVAGSEGTGDVAGHTAGGAGGAGCIFGLGGIVGTGGNGQPAGGNNGACASSIACGSETCTLGQQYCLSVGSGGGNVGTVTRACVKLPASCPSVPGCDCLCPTNGAGTSGCSLSSNAQDCTCSANNGALVVNCAQTGTGGTGGEGGGGGGGGCRYGLGGFNGANIGGNGGIGGSSSSPLCATPPLCGSTACAPDQEYCAETTFVGGAGNGGGLSGGAGNGGRTGNIGSGGAGGVGGGGGMTDPYHTCTGLPAACAGTPSCDCACPNCASSVFPEICRCSEVNGGVIVSCTYYGS